MTLREIFLEAIKLLPMHAKDYATMKHKGQYRKFAGEEYVEHPKRVATIIRRYKKSHQLDQLVKAALLHDTIEDTNTTSHDLKMMYGALVASLVKELTSDDDGIQQKGKTQYLSDKMAIMSSWALVIKLADRLDNVSDLKTASKKFGDKYSKETRIILNTLRKKRKLSGTQMKIVKAIYKKVREAGY
ncbi:HD domain-containing protein [candidate division WWE3 bacterium]|jgi:(p)ppGpp synthase/HD superfamily hydrolase|nr:HD domain-containing protein [candidate division WWE3 bacterium]